MHSATVAVLLCSGVLAHTAATDNLDFSAGTLAGWEGTGFRLAPRGQGITSQAPDRAGHKALLHRAFVVPKGAGVIRFRAHAMRQDGVDADDKLDVLLLTAGKQVVPKQVRTAQGWKRSATLLPRSGESQEYLWSVAAHVGQIVRIVLVDEDDRPGSCIVCSGFQILARGELEAHDFSQAMVRLARHHNLTPMLRYDSPHFIALSNAEEQFSENRVRDCERLYVLFRDHFRRNGFALREPGSQLMVAIFDTQAGFEAYLGCKMSPLVTGIYHLDTNRLVTYDFGQNEAFLAAKDRAERQGDQIALDMDRKFYLDTLHRRANEHSSGTNISTVMHETAHQLSFNCGLLNRDGDRPLWLVEGLAAYCEPAQNGVWLGIGAPNPARLAGLAMILREQGRLLSLPELLAGDSWIRGKTNARTVLLGYAQSWALFHMLMQEQPRALRAYLALIYQRPTADHRLTDFQQAFGADLPRLERDYRAYVKTLVERHVRQGR